ncbi:hypothetical protein [Maridesulfovibrio salexigens]|uniref:Uncharacterized protein n=1 Tax=Maridesulfovibrio salexigens (strain ATCC 14822 / DSM 2638 / NCIMB 8403 / VKM B-1763) TaxID=526222 RepID=C6C1Q2_MARSD|nr:hypothetical protein [Maridesulfovibrio salexigens]ACS79298.1 hypothetical protein Desal_1235 [Maridesulfovibrio salexigens DSM 2638]
MERVMTGSRHLLLFVLGILIFMAGSSFAAEIDDDVSYFSTPEEVDAADIEVRNAVASEAYQSAKEVAKIENEIKTSKQEVRKALKEIVEIQKADKTEMLAAATERLSAVREMLSKVQKNADEKLADLTGVKQSTIASMRSQKMGVTEISRELGATPESIVASVRVGKISSQPDISGPVSVTEGKPTDKAQPSIAPSRVGPNSGSLIGVGPKGSISRELGPKGFGLKRGKVGRIGGGTVRDLKSGVSITPGAIGGKGDKSLGLSRVSGKAKLGSKYSHNIKSLSAIGGRGDSMTTRGNIISVPLSQVRSVPGAVNLGSMSSTGQIEQGQTKK